jgi:hypothetical protein
MRIRRPGPGIDRATAEALLSRRPRPRATGSAEPDVLDAVEALLAAASAPGRPAELAGEQAALAAFRAAGLKPPAPRTVPSRIRATARRLAVVQASAVVGMVTGGVALAAAAGVAPAPLPWAPSDARPEQPVGPSARPARLAWQSVPPAWVPTPATVAAPTVVPGFVTAYPPAEQRGDVEPPMVAAPVGADAAAPNAPATVDSPPGGTGPPTPSTPHDPHSPDPRAPNPPGATPPKQPMPNQSSAGARAATAGTPVAPTSSTRSAPAPAPAETVAAPQRSAGPAGDSEQSESARGGPG